jgi:hypothetical protein
VDVSTERRSWILLGVLLVAVVGVGAAGLVGLKRAHHRETCLWQLSRVGIAVQASDPLHLAGWDRVGTGRRFFLDVANWPGPPPFPIDPEWFCCPMVGAPLIGRIDYRGPAKDFRRMDRDDVLVADRPGNHGSGSGGNVLLRSGTVRNAPEADPAWTRAVATTTDREN